MDLFKKVQIGSSSIQGKGLFALCHIKKGERIFLAEGPIINYPFLPNYRKGPHWLNVGEKKWMMPLETTPWRFINHSCEPNVGLKGKLQVTAMRDILAGEEINIDYSITESHPNWEMNCLCGSKNCRKTIRSIQYLNWERFQIYQDFIPPFLKKMYFKEKIYPTTEQTKTVKAKLPIKKGEILFKVEGPIVNYKFPPNYRIGPKWLGVGKQKWIIPLRDNALNFIKQSCCPNTGILDKNLVVAIRDIEKDEILTMDDTITETDSRWKKKCDCGQVNCRRIIRSIQFLPPELYKKYLPYIPTFAQAAYLEAKGLALGTPTRLG